MIQPGRVVHSVRQLDEHPEVLGAKIELSVQAPEVEALVLPQLPRGVLGHVAAMLRFGRKSPQYHRGARLWTPTPQQRLARSRRGGKRGGGALAHRPPHGGEARGPRAPRGGAGAGGPSPPPSPKARSVGSAEPPMAITTSIDPSTAGDTCSGCTVMSIMPASVRGRVTETRSDGAGN